MADFTAVTIETQEQFDDLVKDRLARQEKQIREQVSGEYADYKDLKRAASEHETARKGWETEKDDLNGKLESANTRIKTFEMTALKAKILAKEEIPWNLREQAIELLKGETEDEIKASAKLVKTLLGKGPGGRLPQKTPIDGGGGQPDAYLGWSKQIGGTE
ncbi:MAG: hypothetical protein LBS85_00045 [Clostridiales Family XIII bacterium]|jgi:hypothetical protein|nr:hypothetical protein [Clostridiales Family XIII bacterium]